MTTPPFIIERILDAPVKKVWKALTDKDDMKQWYFDLAEFNPEVGFEFRFPGGKDPARPYIHICKIIEVTPLEKMAYSWRYEGYPGISLVIFDLFPEGDKTRLRLAHFGLESFAASSNPDLDAKNFAEGWAQIIGTSLPDFLKKY